MSKQIQREEIFVSQLFIFFYLFLFFLFIQQEIYLGLGKGRLFRNTISAQFAMFRHKGVGY